MKNVMRFLALAAFLIGLLNTAGQAQTVPNTLLEGTMAFSREFGGSGVCAVQAGPSFFQRNGSGPAHIAFPEMIYASFTEVRKAYSVSGGARLVFVTATRGNVNFDYHTDYPVDIRRLTFQSYSQTFNPATGEVRVIFFLNVRGCQVRVAANYRL
jgi:hypothetical protein